jgi:hypothetical protein
VKLRGFRIELGEIETVLNLHPLVQKVVVVAREDDPDDKRLVAYVVPAPGQTPTVEVLRRFLQAQLPEYMLPAQYVLLEALPLTTSGKVDCHRLPNPERDRPALEEAFVAPRTPVEEVLAQIWGEVLKVERVGVHDDFFALGGHSLLATQVVSRLHRALQVEVPVRSLFENSTVTGLAELVETIRSAVQGTPASASAEDDIYEEGVL